MCETLWSCPLTEDTPFTLLKDAVQSTWFWSRPFKVKKAECSFKGKPRYLWDEQQAQSHSHRQMSVSEEQHEHPVGVKPRHQREPAEERNINIVTLPRAIFARRGVSAQYTKTHKHTSAAAFGDEVILWTWGTERNVGQHHNPEALLFHKTINRGTEANLGEIIKVDVF